MISFLSFLVTHPNLFNRSVDLIWTWYTTIFVGGCNPVLQTGIDISFKSYYFVFKDNEINVNIPNVCPKVY